LHAKNFSAPVVTFKLAAALEQYEEDLRACAETWRDGDLFRRIQQQFAELRILGASLPKLSASWVAVLVSRAQLLDALCHRTAPVMTALQDHLSAVACVRERCLRSMGADGAALAGV
jgi:hypothetical protein